jgi:hypothetical protein
VPASKPADRLLQRDDVRAVAAVAACVRAGDARLLWIAGDGRRALIEWAAGHAAASGFEVLRARPRGPGREGACGVLAMLLHREEAPHDAAPSAAVAEASAAALARLLRSLAGLRPLAIVVDGAQRADAISVRTLVDLVAAPGDLAVLVVLGVASARDAALRDALARLHPGRPATGIELAA